MTLDVGPVTYTEKIRPSSFSASWPEIADIWARAAVRGFLQNNSKTNMAAEKRAGTRVDYLQLNSLSSVVLFDTARKKYQREKLYDVERIIQRRKKRYVRISE